MVYRTDENINEGTNPTSNTLSEMGVHGLQVAAWMGEQEQLGKAAMQRKQTGLETPEYLLRKILTFGW